ncbi:MAG: hypothetical protein AAGC44_09765 [Planctomycetota bacterium]
MTLLRANPSFQYTNSDDGLAFWSDYLGFQVIYDEGVGKLRVVRKDSVTILLETNKAYAKQLPPLLRIETDDAAALWAELSVKPEHSEYVHERFVAGPELRPWNAWEFAVQDKRACVVFQQWRV